MERPSFGSMLSRAWRSPPIRDWRFWVIQALVMLVAFIHLASHLGWPVPTFGMPHFSTMALFMIPMAYAALSFGLGGAAATSAWVILLMTPDLAMHTAADRWANSLQLASILAASLLVGYQVEVERFLRRRTEEARARYRELFETNRSAILVVGADGLVKVANPAAARSLGAASGAKLADLLGVRAAADILRGRPPDLIAVDHGTLQMILHPAVTPLKEEADASLQIVLVDVTRERQEQKRSQDFAAYVLRGQEEERQRLSQELHDDPLQTMLHLSRQLDNSTAQPIPKDVADSLDEGRRIALEAAGGLRRLSKGLRPWSLEDLGLPAALRQSAAELQERTGIEVAFSAVGTTRRLDGAVELALFRVAEEALRNVERHAGASQVKMTLKFESKRTLLTVADDGAGFRPQEEPGILAGSLGLFGMQERCAALGGEARVRSKVGRGTTVRAVMPTTAPVPRAGSAPHAR
jgi:signal transduction histidine kinase